MTEKRSTLETFGKEIVKIGARYHNVVVIAADSSMLMYTKKFDEVFPDRHFNLGMNAGNVIGVAAGFTVRGFLPFVCVPAMRVGQMWEQMRNQVCYPNLNVKLVSAYAGLGAGQGGGMKQPLEDVALMRTLPMLKIVTPVNAAETRAVCETLANDFGPTCLRLSDVELEEGEKLKQKFEFGKSCRLREGKDAVLFTVGDLVEKCLAVAEGLSDVGVSVAVVHLSSLNPVDEKTIIHYATHCQSVITVEDHNIIGGVGSLVMEVLNQNEIPRKVHRLGVKNSFGESGLREELYEKWNLDIDGIGEFVRKVHKAS